MQTFLAIGQELTEKSAKNTQRWWKLTAGIVAISVERVIDTQSASKLSCHRYSMMPFTLKYRFS